MDQDGGGNGSWKLLIARLDGTIQIYNTNSSGSHDDEPDLAYYAVSFFLFTNLCEYFYLIINIYVTITITVECK